MSRKKVLKVLSTTAIAALLMASTSSTVLAKATKIAVNSTDGKVYEYKYDELETSYLSQMLKGSNDSGAKLYNDFLQRQKTVKALYDDTKKAYIDYDTISNVYIDTLISGKSFNLTSFMEAPTTPTIKTLTASTVSINTKGQLEINGKECETSTDITPPNVNGIYSAPKTSDGKDRVIVYFTEAMDLNTISNAANYKFKNGDGYLKTLPQDTIISVGGDNKSAIIEFPSTYHLITNSASPTNRPTDIIALTVSNVKDVVGNYLDSVSFTSKISASVAGTNVRENTIKTYYDGDDLKVEVSFTRALDEINAKDFTLGGVTPNSARINGDKAILTFKDEAKATDSEITAHPVTYANGKTNTNPTKIDVIKSQGVNAKFAINATTTTDETGAKVSINDDGTPATLSKEQSTIYVYQAAPKTTPDYWSATKDSNGGTVYVTFDTPLDPNSGIKSDDFTFVINNGNVIKCDSLQIVGNTIIFRFNSKFTDTIDISIKNTASSITTIKDVNGNYSNYIPSSDDLKKKTLCINK